MKISNTKDAERIAKKTLKKQYGEHKIRSITHATGTNVWTVSANTDELEITLSFDEVTGKMLGEPSVHRVVKRIIVEPPITITDKISGWFEHQYEEIHWKYLIATVGLTITGSIVSAFFNPIWGISISLVFGCLSIVYGRFAFTRYKERTHF